MLWLTPGRREFTAMGRFPEACAQGQASLERDPCLPSSTPMAGDGHSVSQSFDEEAIELLKKAIEIDPTLSARTHSGWNCI